MKNSQKSWVIPLICALFLISISCLQYYNAKNSLYAKPPLGVSSTADITYVSSQQIYDYLQPIIITQNTYLLAQHVGILAIDQAKSVINLIISDTQSALTSEQKILLIVAGASQRKSVPEQHELLTLFLQTPALHASTPLLFVAANSRYSALTPTIFYWILEHKKTMPAEAFMRWYKITVMDSFMYAILENDVTTLTTLLRYKVPLTSAQASELLWFVIGNNKNTTFVTVLVSQASANVDYARHGKTLLIKAVENNNAAMVQTLITQGAQVNLFVDPAIGTPLQIAIQKNRVKLEALLRKYGARE
jgi:Ankyrin repeats (3 copies)